MSEVNIQELERVMNKDSESYEALISCANQEDADGLIFEAKQRGVVISEDQAWKAIAVYQTQGNAY